MKKIRVILLAASPKAITDDLGSKVGTLINNLNALTSSAATKGDITNIQTQLDASKTSITALNTAVKNINTSGNAVMTYASIINGPAKAYASASTSASVVTAINTTAGVEVLESTYICIK